MSPKTLEFDETSCNNFIELVVEQNRCVFSYLCSRTEVIIVNIVVPDCNSCQIFRTAPRTLGVKHGPPSNRLEVVVERSTAGRVLSPRAWPVSNKSPSPKCLLITSVQQNLGWQVKTLLSCIQIAPNWFYTFHLS